MTRPAHISPADWYRMPWHARHKVLAAIAKANRDTDTTGTRHDVDQPTCPDCGVTISRYGRRCNSCASRIRMNSATTLRNPNGTIKSTAPQPDRFCGDCGVKVSARADRCAQCEAASRRIVDKPCVECGALTMRRSKRCTECQRERHLRLKRESDAARKKAARQGRRAAA